MAKRSRSQQKQDRRVSVSPSESSGGLGGLAAAFAAAGFQASNAPDTASDDAPSATETPAAPRWPVPTGKVRAKKERKQRGGKTVTLLGPFAPDEAAQKHLAKALGKHLGCGAFVDAAWVGLQGDHMGRALEAYAAVTAA